MAMLPFGRSHSNWDSWDPFQGMSLFNRSPALSFAQDAQAIAGTRVDWVETPESHILTADLPGLTKEDVKVELEDGRTLQISGERNKEEVNQNDTWHRVERSHSRFLRRFRLPDNANVDAVKAKVDNGVLTVTVPKIQTQEPETRTVAVAKGSVQSVIESRDNEAI